LEREVKVALSHGSVLIGVFNSPKVGHSSKNW
jgi:hypothetical protein